MTGFLPVSANLGQVDELVNISHNITYTNGIGNPFPVTITPLQVNPITIGIAANIISGYYDNVFTHSIYYRNKDDTFTTVSKFDDINTSTLYDLVKFTADTRQFVEYTYLAQANGESKVYNMVVMNNWNRNIPPLVSYSKFRYRSVAISWSNARWMNNQFKDIEWINKL